MPSKRDAREFESDDLSFLGSAAAAGPKAAAPKVPSPSDRLNDALRDLQRMTIVDESVESVIAHGDALAAEIGGHEGWDRTSAKFRGPRVDRLRAYAASCRRNAAERRADEPENAAWYDGLAAKYEAEAAAAEGGAA